MSRLVKSIELKEAGLDGRRYTVMYVTFDDGNYEVLVSGYNSPVFKRAYGSVSQAESVAFDRPKWKDTENSAE